MSVSQSHQANSHERLAERTKSSKPTGRLRLACDTCHRAKTRCSGSIPCLTCQMYQTLCIYSPGTQPGRPKGSKNKQTSMQQSKNKRANGTQGDKSSSDANRRYWSESDSRSVDFTEDLVSSTSMDYLVDSMGVTGVHMSLEDDMNAFFAQTATEQLSQPLWPVVPFATPDSSRCDRADSDQPTLSSPCSPFLSDAGISRPPDTLTIPEPEHCSCLQQQAQLVYQLGDLQYFHTGGPTVDCILKGVHWAQAPWKSLMECSWCQESQKEALLLFAMSIRILLTSIQTLNKNPYNADASHEFATGRDFPTVSVGSFELTGEMKAEVMNVVIQKALESITSALLHLRERIGQSSNSNGVPESTNSSILTSISTELQKAPSCYSPPLVNWRPKDIGSLLNTLQCTMQTMKQDIGEGKL